MIQLTMFDDFKLLGKIALAGREPGELVLKYALRTVGRKALITVWKQLPLLINLAVISALSRSPGLLYSIPNDHEANL
jgi:hypothetical protein